MSSAAGGLSVGAAVLEGSRRALRVRARGLDRSYRLSLDVLEERATPATFFVTTAIDAVGHPVPGSLRWAIARANRAGIPGATIEITPAVTGPIVLHGGELAIGTSMLIDNASGHSLTIAQATPTSRVFHVLDNTQTVAFSITGRNAASRVTLTGGNVANANGGGILVDNPLSTLTLNSVNVVGNSAAQVTNRQFGIGGNGGGIASRGSVALYNSAVSGNIAVGTNSASGHAGGVYTDQGILLVGSHVDSNVARNAGGILNVTGAVEVLDGSTVNGNRSTGNDFQQGDLGGGGIGQMNGNVVVSRSQVNNNHTPGMYSGGIVLLIGGVTVTNGSQVNGNTNNGPGGGIAANFGGEVVVTHNSQVNGNTGAGVGGGIVNWGETFGIVVADRSQVSGNILTNAESSSVTGGLIQVAQAPNVRSAFLSGGRGDTLLAGALQLFVNTIAQRVGYIQQAQNALPANGAPQVGAGLSTVLGGPIEVYAGSTISNNVFRKAGGHENDPLLGIGGGVFANLGNITIDASTIRGNVANSNGGGIWNGRSLTISNSLVTGNTSLLGRGGGIFNRGRFSSSNTSVVNNTPDNIAR